MATMSDDDPRVLELICAVQAGDVDSLARLLDGDPGLARVAIQDGQGVTRTPLHVATDWPGYFPGAPHCVRLLLDRGADPDAPSTGGAFAETPLHWAASTDDVEVAEVLIGGGANLEAAGGSIAGSPLANAVGYGCWHVARLLVARGARVEQLWQAAALGHRVRVEQLLAAVPAPSREQIDEAFWQACHGGQRRIAELLHAHGADVDATPRYARQTPLAIAAAPDTRRESLIVWLREHGATPV